MPRQTRKRYRFNPFARNPDLAPRKSGAALSVAMLEALDTIEHRSRPHVAHARLLKDDPRLSPWRRLILQQNLGELLGIFYLACALFVALVMGPVMRFYCGLSTFKFLAYLKEEIFIVLGTSSSESVLPRLICSAWRRSLHVRTRANLWRTVRALASSALAQCLQLQGVHDERWHLGAAS